MKKFMFTALVLVAFSGVSMANTVEEKDDELLRKSNRECAQIAINYVDYFEAEYGFVNESDADLLFDIVYNTCVEQD